MYIFINIFYSVDTIEDQVLSAMYEVFHTMDSVDMVETDGILVNVLQFITNRATHCSIIYMILMIYF